MARNPEIGIDELARRSGTTVRNVRLYQERGLLPRPRREGRAAFYGEHHLVRLRLVLRLMERGYSLAAIKDLVDAWDDRRGLGHVLGVEEALSRPFAAEEPMRLDVAALAERFPDDDQPEVTLARAVALGILVPDGDGYVVPSPVMLDVGAELVAMGIPLMAVLDVAERIQAATAELADAFVEMFLEHVWAPFDAAGEPSDRAPAVAAAIDQTRPLAARVVVAAIGQAMQARVDREIMLDHAETADASTG
jgi:DNA-binding transcriptional MerR regulator